MAGRASLQRPFHDSSSELLPPSLCPTVLSCAALPYPASRSIILYAQSNLELDIHALELHIVSS